MHPAHLHFHVRTHIAPVLIALGVLCTVPLAKAQAVALPDAPSAVLYASTAVPALRLDMPVVAAEDGMSSSASSLEDDAQKADAQAQRESGRDPQTGIRPQPKRIFGILPNFTTVSGGTTPPPPGWRTNFRNANRQNYDYSQFAYLAITSGVALAQDSHPSLDVVNGGNAPYWAYLWRGFVDKTDGQYQGSFLFPSLLHEDTRYYAKGTGSAFSRTMHAVDSVVIARTYSGRPIFNFANMAGKAGTQAVSTTYYPAGSEDFGVLAKKFAYACARQAGFAVLREFSPDLAAKLHRHAKN